jgi:hypothetical protein
MPRSAGGIDTSIDTVTAGGAMVGTRWAGDRLTMVMPDTDTLDLGVMVGTVMAIPHTDMLATATAAQRITRATATPRRTVLRALIRQWSTTCRATAIQRKPMAIHPSQ